MEMAYHDLNQREYELTKHVSLLQVDPLALLQLRTTGRCTVRLPEALFDMDGPGHYFRRIKTVAVSIPCVTGPYASVNCTLTLLKSSIRKTRVLAMAAMRARTPRTTASATTSAACNRSSPARRRTTAGCSRPICVTSAICRSRTPVSISEWQLELPANPAKGDPCQFDYDTISDVILHIRYTAREAGGQLRKEADGRTARVHRSRQRAWSRADVLRAA